MIYIRKGTEPRSLTEYRNQPGATYEGYREKDALRDALLEEQGYICAYCMRRISKEKMKIEHWKAQNAPDGTGAKHALEYQNMLGVCLGNQSSPHDMQTCDTYRGNAELFVDPRKEAHTQQIAYRGDGTIYSEDSRIDFDLNQRLNLNCEGALLKQGRKEAMLDSARELPVVLITCPDLVSPATAERMLIGNAIVCWVDDMNLLDSINAALSPQIYVEWDSIQIMLPQMAEQSQHLCFGVTEVSRLGGNRILSLLRQAYCESLRGDDRRAFVTVDDIFRQRDKQLSASLQKRLIDALAECNRLSADNTTLTAENCELRQQNATLSSKEQRQDISSYESLLSESMEQYDRLREGVLNLTQRLYGSIGQDFVPSESGEACLCDLERSIFINLAAKQGKK